MGALAKAREIYGWREGMSEDEVVALMKDDAKVEKAWKETGWILGKDGKFRFEIDPDWIDEGEVAKMIDEALSAGEDGSFRFLVDFDKKGGKGALFQNYPQFAGRDIAKQKDTISVDFKRTEAHENLDEVISASTDGSTRINVDIPENIKQKPDFINMVREAIVHETDHLIQEVEGFGRGGGPEEEIARILSEEKVELKGSIWATLDTLPKKEANKIVKRGNNRYMRLMGEASSRTSEERMRMTAKQRAENPPLWGGRENVVPDDLIVRQQSDWMAGDRRMQAAARQAEMDAMPIEAEQTGGGYAAKVEGVTVGVAATRDKALEMAAKYYEDGEMIPPTSLEKREDGKR